MKKGNVELTIIAIVGVIAFSLLYQNGFSSGLSLPLGPSCKASSIDTGYLVYNSGGTVFACNTKTGKVELTATDPSNAANYAVGHLDSQRTMPQSVTVSGSFDNANHTINIVSNLHLTFIGQYKLAPNYPDNAIIHTSDYSHRSNTVIDGTGILDCGNQSSSQVIAGVYVQNLDHYQISGLNIQHCPHVGLYIKGGIYFANNPNLPGLTVDSNSIQNLSIGVDVAGQNAKVTNNCFSNVQQPIVIEPSGTGATQINNGQC